MTNIKYFGVGLSKTCTSSLFEAFKILGFNSRHYLNEASYQHMIRGTSGYDFDFVIDLPICSRYKTIFEIYPTSKFILTIRDIDAWLTSIEHHWKMHTQNVQDWNSHKIEMYGSINFDNDHFRKVYTDHIDMVTKFFKPEQLLIMDIQNGDGWEQLCQFINVDIPDVDFPHSNKTLDLNYISK